jgi:hypothetical protein
MDVGAPAVVAAIADATGVWITDLPATPEKILAAFAGSAPPGAPWPTEDPDAAPRSEAA